MARAWALSIVHLGLDRCLMCLPGALARLLQATKSLHQGSTMGGSLTLAISCRIDLLCPASRKITLP
jgi:hypothetical protein